MFVLGFQEIVPLTAQQIVQTDPEKRFVCERCDPALIHLLFWVGEYGRQGS